VRLTATSTVYVCLRAAGNRTLVGGETLGAGQSRGPFRASAFKLTLGNNGVRLRVNGHTVPVDASSSAIAMRISRSGRTSPLPASEAPTCT
jgi:hypothetical protein